MDLALEVADLSVAFGSTQVIRASVRLPSTWPTACPTWAPCSWGACPSAGTG